MLWWGKQLHLYLSQSPEHYSINRSVASVTFDGTNSALEKMCSTSAEGNVERMNYYVPFVRDDGVAPCGENIYNDGPRQASRVMVRRYALTSMGNKYLEIGINVGPIASVEVLLGDNRGNHIILPWHTWNVLFGSCETIEQRAQLPESDSLQIDDLMVEFCRMYDSPIVKMTRCDRSLYFKPDTVTFLCNLEPCIDYVYPRLQEIAEDVQVKFETFVNVLQQSDVACEKLDTHRAAKIIRDSKYYDVEYLVDCELVACAINDVLADARRKKKC